MQMLVDSAGLWFRAFYGVPSSVRAPDGTPINAVRGFCDGLATLIRNRRPTSLVCALDADWRPQWRVDLLPSYKTHRVAEDGGEEAPDELGPQVDIILRVLSALGIATAGSTGFEADDVLATLARRATEPVEVVTGDRDLFQLVDDDREVTVVYLGRGIAKAEAFDAAAVRAKFGVEPSQYVGYAVLRGDSSDGLPGVAGIGDKTAAKLLTEHGTLQGLQAKAADVHSDVPKRARAALLDAVDYLAAAERVVELDGLAPVDDVDGTLPTAPADPDALDELVERWGLRNVIDRLTAAMTEVAA